MSLFPDVKVKDVAKTLDIHPFMLSRWRKEFREGKLVADYRQRIPIEGKFGHGKNGYNLNYIRAKTQRTLKA